MQTRGELVAALDPSDSVGIIDRFFPDAAFFTEFERFDRHLHKLRRRGAGIDYLVVCSPNYLHDAHIRFGLRNGADVICEKPVVLNPWNLRPLFDMEKEYQRKVHCILQLRHHPTILALKEKMRQRDTEKPIDVELTYITSRGKWYYASWKGELEKSGGVMSNIGIHFFDMLLWIFGPVIRFEKHLDRFDRAGGVLELPGCRVKWFLSLSKDALPQAAVEQGLTSYRSLSIDGKEIEFSQGFTDLHTVSYRHILNEKSYGLLDALPSIELVHQLREAEITETEDAHPLVNLPWTRHPFKRDK